MSWFVGRSSLLLRNGYLVTRGKNEGNHRSTTSRSAEHRNSTPIMSKPDTSSKKRTDSVIEPASSISPYDNSCLDCNLSQERDVIDLIDAVTKLLRYTDLCTEDQRSLVSDLRYALGRIMPGEVTTNDKSLVVSTILMQADNLRLDRDVSSILPIVRKLIAVVELWTGQSVSRALDSGFLL